MIDLLVQTFRSPHITSTTHLVLMLAIARRCGDEKGVCFAKQTTLAADTRLHPKTVGKVIGELEELGLVRRMKGGVDDQGRRSTDHLYITLKAVTLPPTGPDSEGSPARSPGSPALPSHGVGDSPSMESGTPHKETTEETTEERGDASRESDSDGRIDYALAVDLIWRAVGDKGRERSSKPDIDSALKSAIKRRPKGETEEGHLRRILLGIRAYLQSEEARKENGAFERGAHRTIVKDRWASYLDGDAPKEQALLPVDPEIGTTEAPGPSLQRLWAELAREGMPWNEDRGPRPGSPGCRIDPAIQREFGFDPWEGEQPLEVLPETLALPAPESGVAPADPEADDDDATAFM